MARVKGNWYTFRGGNSVKMFFVSLLKRGLFYKERICFLCRVDPFSVDVCAGKQTGNYKICLASKKWQKIYQVHGVFNDSL